jgi:hypothetical protein
MIGLKTIVPVEFRVANIEHPVILEIFGCGD